MFNIYRQLSKTTHLNFAIVIKTLMIPNEPKSVFIKLVVIHISAASTDTSSFTVINHVFLCEFVHVQYAEIHIIILKLCIIIIRYKRRSRSINIENQLSSQI